MSTDSRLYTLFPSANDDIPEQYHPGELIEQCDYLVDGGCSVGSSRWLPCAVLFI